MKRILVVTFFIASFVLAACSSGGNESNDPADNLPAVPSNSLDPEAEENNEPEDGNSADPDGDEEEGMEFDECTVSDKVRQFR